MIFVVSDFLLRSRASLAAREFGDTRDIDGDGGAVVNTATSDLRICRPNRKIPTRIQNLQAELRLYSQTQISPVVLAIDPAEDRKDRWFREHRHIPSHACDHLLAALGHTSEIPSPMPPESASRSVRNTCWLWSASSVCIYQVICSSVEAAESARAQSESENEHENRSWS